MSDKFIKVYNKFYTTKEYITFKMTNKSALYEFLRAYIIRESDRIKIPIRGGNGGYRIYRDYFKKGKLVSSYSQEKISEYFGISQPAISKHIKALVEKGFIKIHRRPTAEGVAYDYEFGWYTGESGKPDYKEHYYLDEYFSKLADEERKLRDEAKYGKYDEGPLEMVEENPITAAEEYEHIISKFKTPDGFVAYAMEQCGRAFSAEEMRQHRELWEEVQITVRNRCHSDLIT